MLHNQTIQNIQSIESILRLIKAEQDSANAEMKKWSAQKDLHPDLRDREISAIKEEFANFCANYDEEIDRHANAILEAETELSQATVDYDDTSFLNAVNLINAMGTSMPYEQLAKIAKSFRGNYPAEKFLSELYEKYELPYTVTLTNFEQLSNELGGYISVFNSDADKRPQSYAGIEKTLNKMLDSINSDYRVDLGVSELAFLETVSAAAGLDMTF